MKSKTRQSTANKRRKKATSLSRALVLVDEQPLRAELLREFSIIRSAIKKFHSELRSFQEKDMPIYDRWRSTTFASILSEMEQLQQENREKEVILSQIAFFTREYGITDHDAYLLFELKKNNPKEFERSIDRLDKWKEEQIQARKKLEDFVLGHSEEGPPEDSSSEEFDQEEFEEEFEDLLNSLSIDRHQLTPKAEDYLKEVLSGWTELNFDILAYLLNEGEHATESEDLDRMQDSFELKTIYRKLVRQLHPDLGGQEWNPQNQVIWNEVVEAYQHGDLDRLKSIDLQINFENGQSVDSRSISELEACIEDHQYRLELVQQEIHKNRAHPAWKLSRKRNAEPARGKASRVEKGYLKSIQSLNQDGAYLEYLLRSVRNPNNAGYSIF